MSEPSPVADLEQTEVGSYFVANYPPFSVWTPEAVERDATVALRSAPAPACRWASISTSRSAASGAISVISASTPTRTRGKSSSISISWAREWELYADTRGARGSAAQFRVLRRRDAVVPFDASARDARKPRDREPVVGHRGRDHVRVRARDDHALRSSRRSGGMGVTRLSLGVENFDDRILELNGRAHRSPEIARVYDEARRSTFRRSTSISSPACSARPTRTGARASSGRSSSSRTA